MIFQNVNIDFGLFKRDKHYTGIIGKYRSIDYCMNTKLILSID